MRNSNNTISIAMTTYNGEKYVVKQLESIYSQSRIPDEVIICDDGSSDNTVNLINAFIKRHNLNNSWRLFHNKPNIGWQNNFYKAIRLTSGDIVFFSDQDDVWNKEKLQIMEGLMYKHKMSCLYTGRIIIDASEEEIDARQEIVKYSNKLFKIPLQYSFYEIKTLGCCMCVSRELANTYLKINYPEGGHDSQCGRLAVLIGSLWYLDTPLINYRIHSNNTSGVSGIASYGQSNKTSRIEDIDNSIRWLECLLRNLHLEKDKKKIIEDCLIFQQKRMGFFNGSTSFFYLIRNRKYYRDFTMLCGDVSYKYNINKILGIIRWRIDRIRKLFL